MGQIIISTSHGGAGGYETRPVSASQLSAIRRFVDSVTQQDPPARTGSPAPDRDLRPPHLGANLDVYA